MISDPSFMNRPRPWTLREEDVALCLQEIAIGKAVLESPHYDAAATIKFAELIEFAMELAADFYDGPWPEPLSPEQLSEVEAAEARRREHRP